MATETVPGAWEAVHSSVVEDKPQCRRQETWEAKNPRIGSFQARSLKEAQPR